MTKYFTDESGARWEECPIDSRPEHIVIRPVQNKVDADVEAVLDNYPREYIKKYLEGRPVQKQWEVTDVRFFGLDGYRNNITVYSDTTKDQAQLIKEAIEALMGYMMGEDDRIDDYKLDKARTAIRGGEK